MEAVKTARESFYAGVPSFWHNLYGDEYGLFDAYAMTMAEREAIKRVTDRVGHIFFKMAEMIRCMAPKERVVMFKEMGYPKETFYFLQQHHLSYKSVIARLDLVATKTGYKVLEINADTPTFIKECFVVGDRVSQAFELGPANEGEEELLHRAINQAVRETCFRLRNQQPNIVFTSHDNEEDRETTLYLKNRCELPSSYVPLSDLQIDENGLYDGTGKKIDILYRQTYAVEVFVDEVDPQNGQHIGHQLVQLVNDGKLAIINPPSAFLLQNKALMAVIWGLHADNHELFTPEEHGWIESYFLPTYLEPDIFLEGRKRFVKKPVFGREGDTVQLFDRNGEKWFADSQMNYNDYVAVYQEYAEMPVYEIQTENCKKDARLLIGSFLIGGRASAIGMRAGGMITNNGSYFLPIGITKNQL